MDNKRLLFLIKKVSPKYLAALYLVLVLAMGLCVASIALQPQKMRIAERTRQLKQEQQKVALVENFVLAHQDAEQYLTELQQALGRADTALPDSLNVSAFLAQLEKDAQVSGVKLTNVKPSAVTDRIGYRELPIEVSFEGSFAATMSFLKKLEDGARFSAPAAFLIQQKQNILATRLNLQIFCYGVSPRPAASVAAPGPQVR